MNLEEAERIIDISPEEIDSIKRYLGFSHTGINILSDFTPENYRYLDKSGWKLPETEDDIKKAITDFVNIYAAMYKESKKGIVSRNLIRGTSRKNIPNEGKEVYQFLSTSTDENVAKRFSRYGDAALVRFSIGDNVPFLDVEKYRDENAATENEVIISPFCKVSKTNFVGEYDGYAYYNINLEKTELEELSEEDLKSKMEEILQGFSQNILDMENCTELSDKYEILLEKLNGQIQDLEERKYISDKKDEIFTQYSDYKNKTDLFRKKLQSLLKGLCRQKELEIDKAHDLVNSEKTKKQQIERKQTLIDVLSEKINKSPNNFTELENVLDTMYEDIISMENEAIGKATKLKLPIVKLVSPFDVKNRVAEIKKNIEKLKEKSSKYNVSKQDSLDELEKMSLEMIPVLDSISYGVEISKDLPELTLKYKEQLENQVKKDLYIKVQKTIDEARVDKYLKDRDLINKQGISFLGGLTGKNDLQLERLNNINLKIQLAQTHTIEEQVSYSLEEMMADIYACAKIELGGEFSPKMKSLFEDIKNVYKDDESLDFSEEHLDELSRNKISQDRNALPIIPSKSFLGKNKIQTELIRKENEYLQTKLNNQKQRSSIQGYSVGHQDAINLIDSKLKRIQQATTEKSELLNTKNLIHTIG